MNEGATAQKPNELPGDSVAVADPLHQRLHQEGDLLHLADQLRRVLDADQRRRLAVELLREDRPEAISEPANRWLSNE